MQTRSRPTTRPTFCVTALTVVLIGLLPVSCAQPAPTRSPNRVDVTTPPPSQATPIQPAVQPSVEPTETAPATGTTPSGDAETRWWLLTPVPVEGQLRVIASGSGAKLMDAREQAVNNARDLLARSLGRTPEDSTVERTAAEEQGGVYTAWVLISAPNSP